MSLVSIIIPVFNAEEFLSKCLDSVINQTYEDIEIIIINDASSDNTLSIIKNYQKKDSRIVLINFEENKGNGYGRNLAIEKANGNYIAFVDADDWIEPNHIIENIIKAEDTNAEIVLSGYIEHITYIKKQSKNTIFHIPKLEDFENSDKLIQSFLLFQNGVYIQPWIYFFKRDFLISNQIKFNDSGLFFEDNIFTAKAIVNCKNLVVLREKLYHYYRHKKSITHTFGRKTIEGRFSALLEVKQLLKDKGIFEKFKDEYTLFFIRSGFLISTFDYFRMNSKNLEIEYFIKEIAKSEFVQNFNVNSLILPPEINIQPNGLSYKQTQILVYYYSRYFNLAKLKYKLLVKFGLLPF